MTISFYRLLDLVVPGWEHQSTRFVNRRLQRLSTCCISFTHRSGQVPLCRLRLVDARADSFRFPHRGQLVTIVDYFAMKYRISLRSPTARLVALDGPESGDFAEGDLYPGELLVLC